MNTEASQPQPQPAASQQLYAGASQQPQQSQQWQPHMAPTGVQRPRVGPIFWGVVFLALCGFIGMQRFAPGTVDGTTFVIAAVFVLAALMLTIGVVVIRRASRDSRSPQR
ncbi:MAG: hypothetical protein GX814_07485 [Microbacteriaceae bacterium]|nr:hypothetical protein [Microbacteriaceae bacterium]